MILRKYNYVNNIMKSFSCPPAYPERRAKWTSSGEITVFAVGDVTLDVPRGKQFFAENNINSHRIFWYFLLLSQYNLSVLR